MASVVDAREQPGFYDNDELFLRALGGEGFFSLVTQTSMTLLHMKNRLVAPEDEEAVRLNHI
jgi:hypothetical protein